MSDDDFLSEASPDDLQGRIAALEQQLVAQQREHKQELDELHEDIAGAVHAVISEALKEADASDTGPAPTRDDAAATWWADVATAEQWHALVEWVDALRRTYGFRDNQTIPACWPAHGGIVEELAALHRAWLRAAHEAAKTGWEPGEDLAYWHDRYLPGVLARIHHSYQCGAACTDAHHAPDPHRPPTTTDFVIVRSTGEIPF